MDADGIPERLRHFLYTVEAFEDWGGQRHLRFLPIGALQFAAHQQIEPLVRTPEFYIGFERDRVISLDQRVKQFVHGNGLLVLKPFVEVLALQQLRNCILRH